jgi:hypothetical protein
MPIGVVTTGITSPTVVTVETPSLASVGGVGVQ